MKRLQKWTSIIFCISLIIGGSMTVGLKFKSIGATVIHSIKDQVSEAITFEGIFTGFTQGMDSGVTENFWLKEKYIDLYGLVENLLGRDYIRDANPSNTVVKDTIGNLHFITFPSDYTEPLQGLLEVGETLKESGTPLVFVQAPQKVIEDYTVLPPSVVDSSKANTDALIDAFEEENIDYIDLRENVKEDELDLSKLFYKTDHHWTTNTAFWAVGEVVDYLNENYNMNLDEEGFYTDLNNYNQTTYKNFFLGSQGRRVGKFYAGVDDYTLITPNFDTDYEVTINKSDSSTTYTGNFEETILKENLLDESKSVYTNRYASYFGGDYPEVIIKNKLNTDGKKVLIVKDSYALPFSAFLSNMFAETRLVDLRYYKEDLSTYINEYKPDLVLYVYKSMKTIQ
nr:DHHW family protein [uncultured Niameybacter sp.]